MHVPTNQGADIGMNEIRPLGDDVEIKPAMPVRFKQRNHFGYFLARTRRPPYPLNLINDDDGAIRHRFMPLLRLCQFDMRNEQFRNAIHI